MRQLIVDRCVTTVEYVRIVHRSRLLDWIKSCCYIERYSPLDLFEPAKRGFSATLFQHMQFLFAHFLHVTKATFIWRKLVLSRMVTLPDLFFMWTQACPEGMCTNGTLVPCEVLSLAPGSTSSTFFEQWCGFFYVPQEQISVSAMRRELRFFVLIRNVNSC